MISYITTETNTYAGENIKKGKGNFKPSSEFKKWPLEGIITGKMLDFLALTYMGIVKKDAMKSYWSVDSVLSTPFPRNVIHVHSFTTFCHFFIVAAILSIQVRVNLMMIQGKNLEKFLLFYKNNLLMYRFPSNFQLMKERYHSKGKYTSKSTTPINETNMG